MATLHAYLNFDGNCEEAFQFYASVFETELTSIVRFSSLPDQEGMPPVPEEAKNKVMHTGILINDHIYLMGSDVVEGFCSEEFTGGVTFGTGTYLMLDAESPEEAQKLFERLSEGGQLEMPLGETEWAELYSSFRDQYGIAWMINYTGSKNFG
jgi:PhnB protein